MEEKYKKWRKGYEPDDVLPEISVEELTPEMHDACDRAGWKTLVPVQAKSIPYFLAGRDMMVQSRTAAAKLALTSYLLYKKINAQKMSPRLSCLFRPANLPFKYPEKPRCWLKDRYKNSSSLWRGRIQCAVGIISWRRSTCYRHTGTNLRPSVKNTLSLDHLKILIFDEADRMLSMGFIPIWWKFANISLRAKYSAACFPQLFAAGNSFSRSIPASIKIIEFERQSGAYCRNRAYLYVVPGMRKERSLCVSLKLKIPPPPSSSAIQKARYIILRLY